MDAARLGGVGAAEAEAERDAAEVERDAAEAEAEVGMAREAVREAAREVAARGGGGADLFDGSPQPNIWTGTGRGCCGLADGLA